MDVRFYETEAGRRPVIEYLRTLPKEVRAKVGADIRALQTHGLTAPGVSLKPVRGKLWELRSSYERIFYVLTDGPTMWLLHAYEKDTERTPNRAIRVAQQRMREVLARK